MTDHSIGELAALSGLSVRTIRYYLAEGLIPSAGREGSAARYPEATLARLRLIAKLRDANQPLAEIRRRLERLADDEVVELLGSIGGTTPPPLGPAEAPSALEYVRSILAGRARVSPEMAVQRKALPEDLLLEPSFLRLADAPAPQPEEEAAPPSPSRSQWERISLTSDIELHVRRPLSRRDNRIVERLIAFARQLQGEDRP